MNRRMIAACFVDDALDCLRVRGGPVEPVLAAAGLEDWAGEPISPEQYGSLWLAMAAAMDDEFFGLGGRPMPVGSFILLCHCILHSGTLERSLRRMLRFLGIVIDDPHAELEVRGGLARIVLRDRSGPRSAFAYRTFWLLVHGISSWLVGRRIPIHEVDFRCGPPGQGGDYRLFFGAPVQFNQMESSLSFDAALLRLPTIRDERGMRDFLRRAPTNLLVRYQHDAGFSDRIHKRLRTMPPVSWPSFEQMAQQMRMPASTLRRRLRTEGQSYQAIKDEIRRTLAIDQLLHTPKSVGEISADLGFLEPSAFHRAFRKWTLKSPGEYRNESGAA
jgi:AraC-like DNA-binding protein